MYRSAALVWLVPLGVVTVTSIVPAGSAGAVAVIWLSPLTMKLAPVLPKLTAVAPVKLAPAIVTAVPPVLGPDAGLTLVTLGGGGGPPC